MVANLSCPSSRRRLNDTPSRSNHEEFLCPKGWCGQYVDHGPGWTGAFSQFHTCVKDGQADHSQLVDAVVGMSDEEYNGYIARGYHTNQCSA